MKKLDITGMLTELCKATNQYGILLSLEPWTEKISWQEVQKAVLCLDLDEDMQAFGDGYCIILGSKEEIERAYDQTVGDDGPTELNKYDGPARVYALTCDNTGQTLNENT